MTVFVVVGHLDIPTLKQRVEAEFPGENYHLPPSTWFVSFNGTSRELSERIGLANGVSGAQGAVIAIGNWYGYGPADLWEWINSRKVKDHG